ncbi:hypothetical protein EVAR_65067_1 [Eumeta japonica]|uniref:Uncharacterized protein n=1 Tax=Eumeta variegata TaxID=151549 RepID=A0A4C1ZP63_EUMVA|nr:hypothetical protein EVAR_65067_1 [Eumeta japonica]
MNHFNVKKKKKRRMDCIRSENQTLERLVMDLINSQKLNQEEYTTLAQTIVEIRKAADELFRLSEMDVKACTKQRKRRTKEKQKEHTFPTVFIDTL